MVWFVFMLLVCWVVILLMLGVSVLLNVIIGVGR